MMSKESQDFYCFLVLVIIKVNTIFQLTFLGLMSWWWSVLPIESIRVTVNLLLVTSTDAKPPLRSLSAQKNLSEPSGTEPLFFSESLTKLAQPIVK